MRKTVAIMAIALVICTLTSCGDIREIDDMAFVIALGIDKGTSNELRLTYIFANPQSISGDSKMDKMVKITVEASNIFSGMDIINTNVSKQISLSHLKLVIFSRDVAENGIREYADSFMRDLSLRPQIMLAVSDGAPDAFFENLSPKLEANPEKYLDGILEKNRAAYVPKTTLQEFYNSMDSLDGSVALPILGVNYDEGEENFENRDKRDYYSIDENQKADIPIDTENKTTVMGLAIFDRDKMVGEGTNNETFYYLFFRGLVKSTHYAIKYDSAIIVFDVTQNDMPKVEVDLTGDVPKVRIEAQVHCVITSTDSEHTSDYNITRLKSELEKNVKKYLKRTTDIYNSDINAIGKSAKKEFLTWQEFKKYNWRDKYAMSEFEINIEPILDNSSVLSGG